MAPELLTVELDVQEARALAQLAARALDPDNVGSRWLQAQLDPATRAIAASGALHLRRALVIRGRPRVWGRLMAWWRRHVVDQDPGELFSPIAPR